ncbi:MAG: tetraacyldisaccharide 4'-kinase [Gemmatimonadota bacterium]|jgi:tetraacyldisaccharide 4'-kinase
MDRGAGEQTTADTALRFATGVERIWRGEAGVAGAVLLAALMPCEAAYRILSGAYHALYTRGVRRQHRVGIPVISVGNISVGGTGKTPVTRWVVEELRRRGARPAVLHGGYAPDEPALHRTWYPDVPVIVGRDRIAGGARAIEAGADVVVLDDGFQHRRLARDLDVVLVAAEGWTARPKLLPRGPWREPPKALHRADIVVVTRRTAPAETASEVASAVRRWAPDATIARVHLRPMGWSRARVYAGNVLVGGDGAPAPDLRGGVASEGTADTLETVGERRADPPAGEVIAVAAIARPGDFVANAVAAGANVVDAVLYRDHHAYDADDVKRIAAVAAGRPIVTTAKDAVKLATLAPELDLWVLEQGVVVEEGAEAIGTRLDALLGRSRRYGTASPTNATIGGTGG